MTAILPVPFAGALTEAEAAYALASRAESTQRAYASGWADFTGWCATHGRDPIPIDPETRMVDLDVAAETVNAYLISLAGAGAAVATMSKRRSIIKAAYETAGFPPPTDHGQSKKVWEGIRRVHHEDEKQAPPLMPPDLWAVVDRLPATTAGTRDAAILLVGFFGALRRSEIARLEVGDITTHDQGLVLAIRQPKTDQLGVQHVALPRARVPEHCPVRALDRWLAFAPGPGPLFRGVHRTGSVQARGIKPGTVNDIIQRACAVALGPDHGWSAHSLRAGFVTFAVELKIPALDIMHQTRHVSQDSLAGYNRPAQMWDSNAVTELGL